MKQNSINISVIIPHKNSVKLLERCLLSIPNHPEIQILVIDDNSSNITEIENLATKLDRENVEFIYTFEGKGAGYARNKGLEKALGKWLLFADADDYFAENAFDEINKYIDSEFDLIVYKHKSVFSDTGVETIRSNYRNIIIDNYINHLNERTESKLRYANNVPWAKLIRHSMVKQNSIKFDEVYASNDTMFSTLCGYYAKKIQVINIPIYIVTVLDGSITRTETFERYESNHNVALRKNAFLRKINHPECQERIISRMIYVLKLFGFRSFWKLLKSYLKYGGKLI